MRLRASTLIESILSLTLISIAFSASLVVFTSITRSGNIHQKMRAHQGIQSIILETRSQHKYVDETIKLSGLEFKKKVEVVSENGLIWLRLQASDKDGRIVEEQNVYLVDDEKD